MCKQKILRHRLNICSNKYCTESKPDNWRKQLDFGFQAQCSTTSWSQLTKTLSDMRSFLHISHDGYMSNEQMVLLFAPLSGAWSDALTGRRKEFEAGATVILWQCTVCQNPACKILIKYIQSPAVQVLIAESFFKKQKILTVKNTLVRILELIHSYMYVLPS